MLTVEDYKLLKRLAKKAGLNIANIEKPRRVSVTRRDMKRLTSMLMEHGKVLVKHSGNRLRFLSWDGYLTHTKNAAKARAAYLRQRNGTSTHKGQHVDKAEAQQ
jgi:hypothetical protein